MRLGQGRRLRTGSRDWRAFPRGAGVHPPAGVLERRRDRTPSALVAMIEPSGSERRNEVGEKVGDKTHFALNLTLLTSLFTNTQEGQGTTTRQFSNGGNSGGSPGRFSATVPFRAVPIGHDVACLLVNHTLLPKETPFADAPSCIRDWRCTFIGPAVGASSHAAAVVDRSAREGG